jgi:ABC-type Fe3+-siderophore transport system permease subunit
VSSPFAFDKPPRRCRQCQAPLTEGATSCWLCSAETPKGGPAAFEPELHRELHPWVTHGAIWFAVVAAAIVGFGVIRVNDPTQAWLFALAVGPALLFTLAGAALARGTSTPWHPLKKVLIFIAAASVSFLLTAVIAILLLLAAIVAFLQWCFGGMPPQ